MVLKNKFFGVFSGSCLLGIVGEKTNLFDRNGEELFVGDMVRIIPKKELQFLDEYSEEEKNDAFSPVPVVRHHYTTFTSVKYIQDGKDSGWIMGLKDADLSEWDVLKIKSFEQIGIGATFIKFGVNFRYFDKDDFEMVEEVA